MKKCVQLLVFLCIAPVMGMDYWSEVSDGSLSENCYRAFFRDIRMHLEKISTEKEIYKEEAIQWELKALVLQRIKMEIEEKKQFHEWAIELCENEPWNRNPEIGHSWALHKWEVRCLKSREIAISWALQYTISQGDWFRKASNNLELEERVLFSRLAESTSNSFRMSQEDIFSQKACSEQSVQ